MAYRNLDEFLTRLEQAGDVARFTIDQPGFDAPEILAQNADKVYLFTDSNGTRIVRNLFGTSHRIEQALRVTSLDLIAERLEQLLEIGKPGAVGVMVSRAMTMFSAIRTTMNRRAPGEYQKQPFSEWHRNLTPMFKLGAAPSVQATLLTGGSAPRMAAVTLQVTNHGISGEFWPSLEVGETVALVIGGDPAFMIAAYAPLPDLIHRSYFASWLRDKPLDMMRLPGLDIEIPSNAETVVVATVKELFWGGTLLDVGSVWTRPNAIYLQLQSAELHRLRDAFIEIMLPLIRRFLPGVRRIQLRNQLGILTVEPHNTDHLVILRQLWAIPISAGILYWLILPETDDLDDLIERLKPKDISVVSKLTMDGQRIGTVIDATYKQENPPVRSADEDLKIEYLIWGIRSNWQQDTPTGES